MESEYISRKIRGKNDLNVLSEAFEFNVANYNNKNTELHNPLLIGETGSGKCIFFNNKSDFVVMADGRLLQIKNRLKRNPKYRIFLYVVLLPFVYSMLILFSSSILNQINSVFETPVLSFENYVLYLMLFFIGISRLR